MLQIHPTAYEGLGANRLFLVLTPMSKGRAIPTKKGKWKNGPVMNIIHCSLKNP